MFLEVLPILTHYHLLTKISYRIYWNPTYTNFKKMDSNIIFKLLLFRLDINLIFKTPFNIFSNSIHFYCTVLFEELITA